MTVSHLLFEDARQHDDTTRSYISCQALTQVQQRRQKDVCKTQVKATLHTCSGGSQRLWVVLEGLTRVRFALIGDSVQLRVEGCGSHRERIDIHSSLQTVVPLSKPHTAIIFVLADTSLRPPRNYVFLMHTNIYLYTYGTKTSQKMLFGFQNKISGYRTTMNIQTNNKKMQFELVVVPNVGGKK